MKSFARRLTILLLCSGFTYAQTPLEVAISEEKERVSSSVKALIDADKKVVAAKENSKKTATLINDLQQKIVTQKKEIDSAQAKFDSLKDSPQKSLVSLLEKNQSAVSDFNFYYEMLGLADDLVTEETNALLASLQGGKLAPDENTRTQFRLRIVMTPMSNEAVENLKIAEKKSEEDAREDFSLAVFKPDALAIDSESKKASTPKNYENVRTLENALGKLIAKLNDQDSLPYKLEREVLRRVLDSYDAIVNANKEKVDLDQFLKDFVKNQQKREASLGELEKKLVIQSLQKNLYDYQSLSRAMTAVINKVNEQASKKGAGNEDSDLRVAFFMLMNRLETYELEMFKKYGSKSPYPTLGWTQLYAQLQNAVGFGEDRPAKMDLMVDFHLARHGKLGILNAPGNIATSIKSVFTNAGRSYSAAASRNWLTGTLKENIRAIGNIGEFALQNPLIASEIVSNLFEAWKLAKTSDPSLAKELWNNIETIYQVTETRNVVVDLLLGNKSKYSEQANNNLISLEMLTLYKSSWWAPIIVSGYLGATGKTTLRRVANVVVPITGAVVTGASYVLGIPLLTMPAFVATFGAVAFDAVAGFAQLRLIRGARSYITPNNELWVSTFLRGLKKFSDTGDLKKTGSSVAKYALGRIALHKTSLIIDGLRKGTLSDFLKDFGSCVKDNKGAVVTSSLLGTAGGVIMGGFLLTATSTVFLPVAVIAGVGTGVCVAATKAFDYFSGKKEKRESDKKEKELAAIAKNLPKNADEGLQEAIDKITDADRKAMVSKLQGITDPVLYSERAWALTKEKIEEKLTELETANLVKISDEIEQPYPDRLFDKIFTDLQSSDSKVRSLAVEEAVGLLKKQQESADKTMASTRYLNDMLANLSTSQVDIKKLKKDWNLYQIGAILEKTAQGLVPLPES